MKDFLSLLSGRAAESYLLFSRGDDGQVASFATAVFAAAAPAQERLWHQVAAAAEGVPAVGAEQRRRRRDWG